MKPIFTFFTFLTLFTFSLFFDSCQDSGKQPSELVILDIISALKNEKELRLSEIVDSIEYVKLETRPECLISNAARVIGEKFIVLLNHQPPQVLLFDRSGRFIRQVGRVGKGPGEYSHPNQIDLSPDETRILIADVWPSIFQEFSVDGSFLSSQKVPQGREDGPFYLDHRTVVFTRTPFSDSVNYPRVLSMNLDTGETRTLYYSNYKRNPERKAGHCLTNDFYPINGQVIFKDALCDTVYIINPELNVQPLFILDIGANTARYICMSKVEINSYDHVAYSCLTGKYLLLVGNHSERFHLVYNLESREAFALSKLKECRGENDYPYGIINDLGGTGPYWFWYNAHIRHNTISDLLQMPDLKELVKSDCFLQADLKTNQYRDRLMKMVEKSLENDNPIIRIIHLRKSQNTKNK